MKEKKKENSEKNTENKGWEKWCTLVIPAIPGGTG
jgi:hypothetical protein